MEDKNLMGNIFVQQVEQDFEEEFWYWDIAQLQSKYKYKHLHDFHNANTGMCFLNGQCMQ